MKQEIRKKNFAQIIKMLGPGLLFAGAAVGVSHLVQSTKAGAVYGFALLWAVLLANLFKYPFFEFGTRYASAANETLIDGYKRQGNWAIALFILLTIGTMFTIQAAVTIVTASLAIHLFGFGLNALTWSAILLAICLGILLIGRYAILDNLMKIVILVLTISTLLAVVMALFADRSSIQAEHMTTFAWDSAGITFLVALMGWMPAPLDLSVWGSIWTIEKKKLDENRDVKMALFDFNVGYFGTVFLALCFLTLGALVLYGTGSELSSKGGVFAGQLIQLYTSSLGAWATPIIAVAAFTTMFSTTLTCLDAFPRVLGRTTIVLFPQYENKHSRSLYWFWILVTVVGALLLLGLLQASMGLMVNIATILSFLTAPFLAWLNYQLVTGKHMPEKHRPPQWLRYLAQAGIVFLTGFSLWYLALQLL